MARGTRPSAHNAAARSIHRRHGRVGALRRQRPGCVRLRADSKEEDIATLTATEDYDGVAVAHRYVANVARLYAMIDGADAAGGNATDECAGVPSTASLASTELARLDNLDEAAVSWEDVDADVAASTPVALPSPPGDGSAMRIANDSTRGSRQRRES
jgi:hypothetical protein